MKTASEVLNEAVRLKESGASLDGAKVLDLLTELARAVAELEHRGSADTEHTPTESTEPK